MIRTSTAELYDAHVMKNYGRAAITLTRGLGAQVWDDQGNCYLDFTSGIAVSALGHCHPHWVAAIQRQAGEGQVRRFMRGKRRGRAQFSACIAQRSGNLGLMFRGKRAARRDQGQNLVHKGPMPAP